MIETFRKALRVPTPEWRRRLLWCGPAAAVVALTEALSFALLYMLLQGLTDADSITDGLMGQLYDLSGAEDTSTFLWLLGGAVVALMLLKGAAAVALLWWQTTTLASAEADSSAEIFDAYMHAPHALHLKTNSAVVIRNVVASITTVYQSVLLSLITTATEAAVILTVAAVLVLSDPVIALLAALLMAVAGIVFLKGLGRRSRQVGRINQTMVRKVQQHIIEGINGVKMLQVLNRQGDVSEQFRGVRREWAKTRQLAVFYGQLPRYYLELVLLLGVAAIGLGASALRDDADAVATVGLLIAAALRMIPSLNKILTALNKAQLGKNATDQISELQALIAEVRDERVEAATADQVTFERELRVDHVTFAYEGTDVPALDDVDISIANGESIGVVGASGSGKSTLIDVLLGLLLPQAGRLVVDGKPIERSQLSNWRRAIGYVPQHIFIADATLRRNVAFGVPEDEIDDERVHEALQMAMLDDFVATLPDGVETVTGEHGVRFSGGQRQRIGIARALYTRPKLLVLDEATSALDSVTEAAVTKTIDSLQGRLTMVIIAHRLSTVRNCDRLVLLEDGRVTHAGSFDELRDESPAFAEMVRHSATSGSSLLP